MAVIMDWRSVLLLIAINAVSTERIKDMIYMPLDGVAACFRRHNGTHQFGCSSSRSGSVGVVHILESEEELGWLEKNATAGPYTVVVPFSMFTRDTLIRLRDTNNINGVLLARNITVDRPYSYSPDDTCPNRYSGIKQCDDTKPWNPSGSALLMEDWPFPMFYMEDQTQLEAIKSCFWIHNAHDRDSQSHRSLCSMEMKSYMLSAVNSESCIRRSNSNLNFNPMLFCDPLGDRNIHWPLTPLNNDTKSVIMVTARLDAASMFDGLSPGAGNTVTGLVTLLATARYLYTLNATVDETNVVFSLLNGEAFDYIGSGRLVYDLTVGKFTELGGKTLKIDQIKSIIELGQLGENNLYLHARNSENDQLIAGLQKALNATMMKDRIPPASVQSFLAVKPNMTVAVIANHGEEYVNRYYQSILDDAESLGIVGNDTSSLAAKLAQVAVTLGNELYFSVTGAKAPPVVPTTIETLISEMLICYLQSANCELFQAASPPKAKLTDHALPLYIGVNKVFTPATTLTGQLLAFLTGEEMHMNITTCDDNHFAWMAGLDHTGVCIHSTVNYSTAISPAFIIDGYDMKSGQYSTWTESVWQTLNVRLFLKPSAAAERLSMIVGTIVASLSFIVVWFINSRATLLFSCGPTDC